MNQTPVAALRPGPRGAAPASPLIEFFRHHGAWAPGVRMFRALQFRAKAVTILAVLLVPVLLHGWNYFGDKADAIGFTHKERLGVEYARAALPLLRQAQHERSLAAGLAGGTASPAFAEQLKQLDAVEARLGAELETGKALAALRATARRPAATGARRSHRTKPASMRRWPC